MTLPKTADSSCGDKCFSRNKNIKKLTKVIANI